MNHLDGRFSLHLTQSGWAARVVRETGTPYGFPKTFKDRAEAERWLVNVIGEVLYEARENGDAA